jgi:predicted dehydrogenase
VYSLPDWMPLPGTALFGQGQAGFKDQVNLKELEVDLTIEGVTDHFKPQPVVDRNQPEQGYWGTSHYHEIRDFYRAVLENQPVPVDGLEAKKALAIVLGVYQSAREKRRINLENWRFNQTKPLKLLGGGVIFTH